MAPSSKDFRQARVRATTYIATITTEHSATSLKRRASPPPVGARGFAWETTTMTAGKISTSRITGRTGCTTTNKEYSSRLRRKLEWRGGGRGGGGAGGVSGSSRVGGATRRW